MYTKMYAGNMKVSITEFRKNLFKLVDKVIGGETVEMVHRGVTIRLVIPESRSSRLDRLTPRQITNPRMTEKEQRAAEKQLQADIQAEWQKDWSEI